MGNFEDMQSGEMPKEDFLDKFGRKVKEKVKATIVKQTSVPEELEMPEEYEDPELWEQK